METKGAPITTLKFAYFLPAFSVSFFLTVTHSIITLTLQGPKTDPLYPTHVQAAQKASKHVEHMHLL